MTTDDMRRRNHGIGTFDRSTRTWKLRTKELTAKASLRFLSDRYRAEITTEAESYPYWRRYLDEVRAAKVIGDHGIALAAARTMVSVLSLI
jgi:hypothetical protein